MKITIICPECKITKSRYFYPLRDAYPPKFCSKKCHGLAMKGMVSIMAGKKHTDKSRNKMSLHHPDQRAELNPNWKGEEVGYLGLHKWVKDQLIKPQVCQDCNQPKELDLANISGEYNRDVSDWRWLCRKCHKAFDKDRIGETSKMYTKYESGTYLRKKEVLS
jgi:hypothetical protein